MLELTQDIEHDERRLARAFPVALSSAIAIFLVIASFAAGILAERVVFQGGSSDDAGPPLDQIERLLREESYYWPDDPEAERELRSTIDYASLQGAIAGTTGEGVLDPYTAFLPPELARDAAQQLEGEYEGIGVYIEAPDGVLTIVSPMPNSPAEEAGLLPGDMLLAADGVSFEGMTLDEAKALVQGPEGSTVRLTILRPGQSNPFDVDVVRRTIDSPVVAYSLDPESKVAVVQVSIFNDKTTQQLDTALTQAQTDGAVGIVLDLRNNGGGWVTAAQEMIGRFIAVDRGVALYEDDDRAEDNELIEVPILGGGPEVFDLPLAVLVNESTASAAEIVAGALRDYERASIVGVTTFGKGSVQRVHDFEDGSSLRITIALWLTPNRTELEGGIAPGIEVVEPEEMPDDADPQLDRAIEVVSTPV